MAEEGSNGRTIAEMAGDDEPLEGEARESFIEGIHGQLSWEVGGLEPASAELTLSGLNKLRLEGEFRKGEEFQVLVSCRVNSVEFADEDDPDGYPEACVKRFKAKVTDYERVEE